MEIKMSMIRKMKLNKKEAKRILEVLSDVMEVPMPSYEVSTPEEDEIMTHKLGGYYLPKDEKIVMNNTRLDYIVHEFVEHFIHKSGLSIKLHEIEYEFKRMYNEGIVTKRKRKLATRKTENIKDAIAELITFFIKYDDSVRDVLMNHLK